MCEDDLMYYCWHFTDQGLQISRFKPLPPGLRTLQCKAYGWEGISRKEKAPLQNLWRVPVSG